MKSKPDKHSLSTTMLLFMSTMCLLLAISIDGPIWLRFVVIGVAVVLLVVSAARLAAAKSAKDGPGDQPL